MSLPMARTSTNALTARYCDLKGWPRQTVQAFYGGRRHDLFGIADTLVLHPQAMLWVQNCSYGTLKAHRDAIDLNPITEWCDGHPVSIQLWEWRKVKVGRKHLWRVRTQVRGFMTKLWGEVEDWSDPMDIYGLQKTREITCRKCSHKFNLPTLAVSVCPKCSVTHPEGLPA